MIKGPNSLIDSKSKDIKSSDDILKSSNNNIFKSFMNIYFFIFFKNSHKKN